MNSYIEDFYDWFVKNYGNTAYRLMGIDPYTQEWVPNKAVDLVMIINRRRGVIEIESNYFEDGHAEFDLYDVGCAYELKRLNNGTAHHP